MKRIGVLVSGGGTNLQAIIDAVLSGTLPAEIGVVISNKAGVFALERAAKQQIPTAVIDHRQYSGNRQFSEALLAALRGHGVDLVCLAGFMRIVDPVLLDAYPHRILNIHPALLPSFGGKGMYGHHVHEAVIRSGAKFSGATVHLVTPDPDAGPIVAQGVVAVDDEDTAESLALKVLRVEHRIYPEAIRLLLGENFQRDGLRVKPSLRVSLLE